MRTCTRAALQRECARVHLSLQPLQTLTFHSRGSTNTHSHDRNHVHVCEYRMAYRCQVEHQVIGRAPLSVMHATATVRHPGPMPSSVSSERPAAASGSQYAVLGLHPCQTWAPISRDVDTIGVTSAHLLRGRCYTTCHVGRKHCAACSFLRNFVRIMVGFSCCASIHRAQVKRATMLHTT